MPFAFTEAYLSSRHLPQVTPAFVMPGAPNSAGEAAVGRRYIRTDTPKTQSASADLTRRSAESRDSPFQGKRWKAWNRRYLAARASPGHRPDLPQSEETEGLRRVESRPECLDPNWRCCAYRLRLRFPRRRRFTVAQTGQTRDPAATLPEIWRMSDCAFLALTEERRS